MRALMITLTALLLSMLIASSSAAPTAEATTSPASPHVIATITLPGAHPTAIAFYPRGDRLFVADEASGKLLTVDAATRKVVSSVFVGHNVTTVVLDETAAKLYIGSGRSTGSSSDGTGLISVVSAETGALLKTINPAPGSSIGAEDFTLVKDEPHGKVYVSLFSLPGPALGVIDVARDEFRPILDYTDVQWQIGGGLKGMNTVTNEVFAVGRMGLDNHGSVIVIHGDSPRVEQVALPHANEGFLDDVAVNEVNNKLYFFFSPIGSWSGLLILDRKTGQYKSIVGPDRESTEPFVFDRQTDTLFTGVGANGTRGLIVDGATDKPTWVNFGESGVGPGAVRSATDNVYFVTLSGTTDVLNGRTHQMLKLKTDRPVARGGSIWSSIAIDQTRGLVYVVNDSQSEKITVIRDGAVQAVQCIVPRVKGMPLASANHAISSANCRTGTVRTAFSTTVKTGRVISQQPVSGTHLAKGSKVNLVVSKGKRK